MSKNDFRVTSIFNIIIRICMKNVEFCGKTTKFLPKRCLFLFIFCIFYLNGKELNQQLCLIKYAENEISNFTSHKKKIERERSKNISNFKNINSKTPEKLSLVLLVTDFHKLLLSPLVVRSWRRFEKQKLVLNLELLLRISYISIASTKDLIVLQISTEN